MFIVTPYLGMGDDTDGSAVSLQFTEVLLDLLLTGLVLPLDGCLGERLLL